MKQIRAALFSFLALSTQKDGTCLSYQISSSRISLASQKPMVRHSLESTLSLRKALAASRGGAFSSQGDNQEFQSETTFAAVVASEADTSSPGQSQGSHAAEVQGAQTVPENSLRADSQATKVKLGGPPPGLLRRTFARFPWHRLPDWLTYVRCMAIPALVYLFYLPTSSGAYRAGVSSLLFASASFTDWLDGYLARRWEITSSFGAFLDPGKAQDCPLVILRIFLPISHVSFILV
jgi:hypothetical protein